MHSTVVVPALSMRLNLGTSSSTNSASVAALVTRGYNSHTIVPTLPHLVLSTVKWMPPPAACTSM